jgi:tetraacyldisaccharide 4'-kinase
MKSFLKIFLWPFSVLYAIVTGIRNFMYDHYIFKSYQFDTPVIVLGNLTVGGTGKTPHAEFILQLLKNKFTAAYLSRGFGRNTHGLRVVNSSDSALTVGDEAFQVFHKFPEHVVAVCENRVQGIQKLMMMSPKPAMFILDDAFQHRSVNASLNILLTDYRKIFTKNYLLPAGTLRESGVNAKRANIIIVTKTPAIFSPLERRRVQNELKIEPTQNVYFSFIRYGKIIPLNSSRNESFFNLDYYLDRKFAVLALTGIANPVPLLEFLEAKSSNITHIKYRDHHCFTLPDIKHVENAYHNILSDNKIIITTEKDAMRLKHPVLHEIVSSLPIFYIPIEIGFHEDDELLFTNQIFKSIEKNI